MKKTSKLLRVILPTVGALLFGVLLVFATKAIRYQVWGALEEPIADLPAIVSEKEMALDGLDTEKYAVTALDRCYDKNDSMVAYKVTLSAVGYNQENPIQMSVTISADATAVRGITIIKQKESQYYGDNIKYPDFSQRFVDRNLPVLLTGDSGRGAHVDGISGATITSQAVVDAVNNAAEFVRVHFVEGE